MQVRHGRATVDPGALGESETRRAAVTIPIGTRHPVEVSNMQCSFLAVAATVAAASLSSPAAAATPAKYVRGAQNADGGFAMTQGAATSTQFATGWAALGLAAAGRNPGEVERGGRSAVDYLRRGLSSITDIGEIERSVLVVRAAGLNPRRFGGRDLVADVLRRRRGDGSISGFVSYTSFGIFALRAGGMSPSSRPIRRAARWIRRAQNGDGGFPLAPGGSSGVDHAGYALQALAAAGGRPSRSVRRGAAYLLRAQNRDGGFPAGRGGASNAQSTAYAVQGLLAARRGRPARRRAVRYLRSLTEANGLVRYSRTSRQTPVWVASQALLAIRGRTFPLAPVR